MKRHARLPKRKIGIHDVLLLVILANLLGIDIWLLFFSGNRNILGATTSCPKACINYINQYTGPSGSASKEAFIPLGTGTNQSTDWQDVPGTLAEIDTARYRQLKKVTLEATLEVPASSQISWVRLYNVTGKHPVWFSEMSMEGSGPRQLFSSPVTLDPGSNVYQVQMKSQLGALTKLTQSQVHILTY